MDRMHEFNQSLKYDKRMYAVDIEGSIAYAKALAQKNILTGDELQKMIQGLQAVDKEWETGKVGPCASMLCLTFSTLPV
jgi:argininosuccinate lyase